MFTKVSQQIFLSLLIIELNVQTILLKEVKKEQYEPRAQTLPG